jgi:tetratricopeptide (TPR) repeat protein
MNNIFVCRVFLFFALTIGAVHSAEQAASGYEALIQQGKSQLQAGSAEQAAASGKSAIKMNAGRWEGYALAGGALMNLKRYEEAADTLSKAIDRVPESKQPALRDLRRQCLLAESGSPAVANTPAPATATSQAEIVLWKSIENSANLADFRSYLDQFPQGAFAVLARRHLTEVEEQERKRSEQEAIEKMAQDRYAIWDDPVTALTWTRRDSIVAPNDGVVHWVTARDYCSELRLRGYHWNLPTLEQLKNLKQRNMFQAELHIHSDTGSLYTNGSDALLNFGLFNGNMRVVCVCRTPSADKL